MLARRSPDGRKPAGKRPYGVVATPVRGAFPAAGENWSTRARVPEALEPFSWLSATARSKKKISSKAQRKAFEADDPLAEGPLEGGPKPAKVREESISGEQLLEEFASKEGHTEIVKLLLEKGAKIERTDWEGSSGAAVQLALRLASGSGDMEIVRLLLQKGANVNATDPEESALLHAYGNGHTEIVRLLLEHCTHISAAIILEITTREGDIEFIHLLLKKDAILNQGNGHALENACQSGHIDILRLLLENRADINKVPSLGFHGNGLQIASRKGDREMRPLEYGNALKCPCRAGHVDVTRLLLAKGADVNTDSGPFIDSVLKVAFIQGHTEIVRLLLEKGADVNAAHGGREVLQAASMEGPRL
ncbi:ankyrin repeat-containing domain protein [Mycena sp. CBHHK59/15]|nr:ankyrin repeat-containing domain protein [Mycena sp. CBHHK59/15]